MGQFPSISFQGASMQSILRASAECFQPWTQQGLAERRQNVTTSSVTGST